MMWSFLRNMLDTSDFPPRWHCGLWTSGHGWLHIVSDLAIFGAYAAIPAVLAFFVVRRKDVPFPPIFWLFAAFIFSCGAGHLVEASLFWHPWYRLSGLLKVTTATVSWATVIAMTHILPKALTLPGLSKINTELQHEICERRRAEELFRQVVEAAPNGMVMVNKAGRIVLVNAEAEKLFGYRREELLNRPVEMLVPEGVRIDHPGHRADYFHHPIARRIGAGRDLTGLRKDGSQVPIEIGLNPLETPDGLMVLSSIVDITERKQAEAELKALNQTLERRVEERARFVRLLKDVAVIANSAETIEDAFQQTVERVCQQMDWPIGHAYLAEEIDPPHFDNPDDGNDERPLESKSAWFFASNDGRSIPRDELHNARVRIGNEVVRRALSSGEPIWLSDPPFAGRLAEIARNKNVDVKSVFVFPVVIAERAVGVFEFFLPDAARPDQETLNILFRIGTQLGRVVERKELERAIANMAETEQRRIGAELHDGLGQELTALSLQARSLFLSLKSQENPVATKAEQLAKGIPEVVKQIRLLIRGVMPVELHEGGLTAALQHLAESTQRHHAISCRLHCRKPVSIDDRTVAHHLFRIAQEAVTNAVKHARPSSILIELNAVDNRVMLIIQDDGCGIDGQPPAPQSAAKSSMGRRIMRHRASLLGGSLSFERAEPSGTRVTCVVNRQGSHNAVRR